jgi:Skp family chaperone for outer membrane proteins
MEEKMDKIVNEDMHTMVDLNTAVLSSTRQLLDRINERFNDQASLIKKLQDRVEQLEAELEGVNEPDEQYIQDITSDVIANSGHLDELVDEKIEAHVSDFESSLEENIRELFSNGTLKISVDIE